MADHRDRRAAGAAAARGRKVRRRRLHRGVRDRAHLRRDHGHPPEPDRARAGRAARAATGRPRPRSSTSPARSRRWHERAAGARHLPQDGARGAARAAGVHRVRGERVREGGDGDRRGARGGRDLDLQPHRGLPRGGRPGARRVRGARPAGPPRRDTPDRARRGDLLAAQLRRRAPALPRDRGPRVDDRRRGGDPGPGQASPRSRDAGGLHGAAVEPPVRRRAQRPASACARRPGSARAA